MFGELTVAPVSFPPAAFTPTAQVEARQPVPRTVTGYRKAVLGNIDIVLYSVRLSSVLFTVAHVILYHLPRQAA